MKVKQYGKDRFHVRVEELLPCKSFTCSHELMSCATAVWCPDGCFSTNTYIGICIPKCIDCVEYVAGRCKDWKDFEDTYRHSALSKTVFGG